MRIEKSFVYFVNTLSSNELLKIKIKRTDFLRLGENEEEADFFDDIIIDNGQALSMANIYTNILNGTMDAYTSIVSNNLSLFIQRLTVITIILMVPTLVASFFGMNVKIPFEALPRGILHCVDISAPDQPFWYGFSEEESLFKPSARRLRKRHFLVKFRKNSRFLTFFWGFPPLHCRFTVGFQKVFHTLDFF